MNNDSINAQDKLAKICPLISIVRDEFVKIEPEEHNSVDKQIIPSKNKVFVYQTKQKNWVFMYDFFIYGGKNSPGLDDGKFGHLQKCAQVVALVPFS